MNYKKKIEVSQRVCTLKSNSENHANFEGVGEGVHPPCDSDGLGLDAWIWATHQAHMDAKASYTADAFAFFFLWNSELEGV